MKNSTLRLALVGLLAGVSTACSGDQPGSGDGHADMGHASMDHSEAAAAADMAPLPDDGVTPVVLVRAAWMRPHPGGRDVTAAYFAARLETGAIDRLVSASIDGAERVELHGHTMNAEGMMQMRAIGPQELTADGQLVFTPGGRHLMVFGLDTVVEGDTATGILTFERAGDVPVTFQVRAMPPGQVTDY